MFAGGKLSCLPTISFKHTIPIHSIVVSAYYYYSYNKRVNNRLQYVHCTYLIERSLYKKDTVRHNASI